MDGHLRVTFAPSSMLSKPLLRTATNKRALPQCFPPFTKMQYMWHESSVWDGLTAVLRSVGRNEADQDPEPTVAKLFADGGYQAPKSC